MDWCDIARDAEERFLAASLAAQERAAALDRPGAAECADCGEPIPSERRRALPSAVRCADCQALAERMRA